MFVEDDNELDHCLLISFVSQSEADVEPPIRHHHIIFLH